MEKKTPSPLPSPTARRGKKEEEKILTAPLTFILSRRGREKSKKEFNRITRTLPSPASGEERRKMKRF
jgi:predicted pyridoxine 5'-phosphate oxidase superfamily flavin-nucleotide-binding protein